MAEREPLDESLRSTAEMLRGAYPRGLPEDDYFPLLALLYPEMSDRALAQTLAHVFGREYIVVWNDIGKVQEPGGPPLEEIARVRKVLEPAGYADWLKEL